MSTNSAWETIKKHSRQLSSSSPFKSIKSPSSVKFSKFHDSTKPITLNLDGNELIFEDHAWRAAAAKGNDMNQPFGKLKEVNKALQEENQLLKFKLEVLLDMLSATKLDLLQSESQLQRMQHKDI